MSALRHLLATCMLVAMAGEAPACGTDALGADSCRKIEQARCRRGLSCPGLGLQGGTGVEECAQFARDRCLHGLASADPGLAVVDWCVSAIDHAATCEIVISPETYPACSFLTPVPVVDAGSDAPADTTGDGSDAAEADAASGG